MLNRVQIISIVIAIIAVAIGVLILIGVIPGLGNSQNSGTVVLWGFDNQKSWDPMIQKFTQANPGMVIKYQTKTLSAFEEDFLNSIARNQAPDIIIFPSSYLAKHNDKLSFAPKIAITQAEINQQYIEASSNFVMAKGDVLGIPFFADALILYWNKDIFTQNFVTMPPANWDDFQTISQKFTKKDSSGNILISGSAMGRSTNISNSDVILSTLFLQFGEKIIDRSGQVILGNSPEGQSTLRPAESAMRFFSDFANPQKTAQSWSTALPEARNAFVAGKLAMYIGYISEFDEIQKQNPHLSFDVSLLPQLKNAPRPITSGMLYALTVPKASKNQSLAWNVATKLAGSDMASLYAETIDTVSVRRDILQKYQSDSVKSVFANSVISLVLWSNPDPVKSTMILKNLIEDVALGRGTLRDSIDRANALFKQ